jgi:Flp pilus assembly protein TadD
MTSVPPQGGEGASLRGKIRRVKTGSVKRGAAAVLAGMLIGLAPPLIPAPAEEGVEREAGDLLELGEKAFTRGDTETALRAFTDALELDRDHPRTWNFLGGAYFRRGDYSQALLHFKQALLLDPDDARACNNIATAYEHLGRPRRAEVFYLKAIEIDGRYPVPYRNLGVLYADRLDLPDRARDYWEKFLNLVPSGAESDAVREELEKLGREERPAPLSVP